MCTHGHAYMHPPTHTLTHTQRLPRDSDLTPRKPVPGASEPRVPRQPDKKHQLPGTPASRAAALKHLYFTLQHLGPHLCPCGSADCSASLSKPSAHPPIRQQELRLGKGPHRPLGEKATIFSRAIYFSV